MANNYAHFDFYDEINFKINAETGYLSDYDISIETEDKQLSFRFTYDQAYALLQKLKRELE